MPLLQKKLYLSFPGVSAASVFASIARKGSSNSAVERLFCELILDGGYHNRITVPHVKDAKPPRQSINSCLGVDKRIQTARLPLYGSVIPAGGNRFPVFQKSRIYMLFKVVNDLSV